MVKRNPEASVQQRCKEKPGEGLTRKPNCIYEVVRGPSTRIEGGVSPSRPPCGSGSTGIADDTLSSRTSSALNYRAPLLLQPLVAHKVGHKVAPIPATRPKCYSTVLSLRTAASHLGYSQQWPRLLLLLFVGYALCISQQVLSLDDCAFSTATSGNFSVVFPGCRLSQMVTMGAGDLMSVSGSATADPLHELQAMGGTPTETEPKRHFKLQADASLKLLHVRLTGGKVTTQYAENGFGGSIYAAGLGALVEISACVFQGCGVGVDCARHGGVLYVKGPAKATIDRSVFEDANAYAIGGAIVLRYNSAEATITGSTFKNCEIGGNSEGGAIRVENGGILHMNGGDNQFISNDDSAISWKADVGGVYRSSHVIFDVCPPGTYQPLTTEKRAIGLLEDFFGCPGKCKPFFVCVSGAQEGHNDLGSFSSGYTQESCEAECLASTGCVSYDAGGNECYLSSTRAGTQDGGNLLDSIYYYKYCELTSNMTTPGHNFAPNKFADANSACTVPCPENQPCVSCYKGSSNDGSGLTSEAQCLDPPTSVNVRVADEDALQVTIMPFLDNASKSNSTYYDVSCYPAFWHLKINLGPDYVPGHNALLSKTVLAINFFDQVELSNLIRILEGTSLSGEASSLGKCSRDSRYGHCGYNCYKNNGIYQCADCQPSTSGCEAAQEYEAGGWKDDFINWTKIDGNSFVLGSQKFNRGWRMVKLTFSVNQIDSSLQVRTNGSRFSMSSKATLLDAWNSADLGDRTASQKKADTKGSMSTCTPDGYLHMSRCYGVKNLTVGVHTSTSLDESSLPIVSQNVYILNGKSSGPIVAFIRNSSNNFQPNTVPYTCQVAACNSQGCSTDMTSDSTSVPNPPQSLNIRLEGADKLRITIEPPPDDGGTNVTHYDYILTENHSSLVTYKGRLLINSSTSLLTHKGAGSSPLLVEAFACNSIGCSVKSAISSIDTPDPPQAVEARVAGVDKMEVKVIMPLNDNGADVTHVKFQSVRKVCLSVYSAQQSGSSCKTTDCTGVYFNFDMIANAWPASFTNTLRDHPENQLFQGINLNSGDSGQIILWSGSGSMSYAPDGCGSVKCGSGRWNDDKRRSALHPFSPGDKICLLSPSSTATLNLSSMVTSHLENSVMFGRVASLYSDIFETTIRLQVCNILGCSSSRDGSTTPPCDPQSGNFGGVCWIFLCPSGSYHTGPAECANMTNDSCPAGQNFGSISAANQNALRGSTLDDGSCFPCARGLYKSTISPTRCLACPVGYHTFNNTASTSCSACPPGSIANTKGTAVCTLCQAGTFSSKIAPASSASCITCGPGMYSDKDGSKNCTNCPAGKKLLENEADGSEYHDELKDCENCLAGQFNPFPGNIECYFCLSANLPGAASCDGCFPGKYKVTRVHSDGNHTDNCIECPSGYYTSQQNRKKCDVCPRGYYANDVSSNTFRFDRCQSCPRGRHGLIEAAVNQTEGCSDCPAGKFSEKEHVRSENDCDGCPRGRWSNASGVKQESFCKNCGAGKHGSTSPGATSIGSCIDCASGKYSESVGAHGEPETCIKCPSGFAQQNAAQAFCLPCVPGKYQNLVGQEKCTDCERGRFRSDSEVNVTACVLCEPGYFNKDLGQSACLPCVPGKYQNEHGMTKCRTCDPGKFASGIQSENCTLPDEGFVAGPSKAGQVQVAVGWFATCFGEGDSRICNGTARCTAGTFEQNRSCFSCPAGYFSTPGATSCEKCPEGRYSANFASSLCDECDADSGFYSNVQGSTTCTRCKQGSEISTGKGCLNAPIDDNLPMLQHVRVSISVSNRTAMSLNMSRAVVQWDAVQSASNESSEVAAVYIQWSNDPEFPDRNTKDRTFAQADKIIRSTPGSIGIDLGRRISLTSTVYYFRARTVRADGGFGAWSTTTQKWSTTQDCFDTSYLDISIFTNHSWDPLEWTCRPCPKGASCKGDITWSGVVAMFGFWRVPGPHPNQFVECAFPGACLGAPNPKLTGRYFNESENGELGIDYAKHQLEEGCNRYFGFRAGSRLCHDCMDDFRRLGQDRCSDCPVQGQNYGLLVLATLLLITGGVVVVWMAIRDAGKASQSEIIRKITFNFLQVSALAAGFPLHWPPEIEALFDFQGAISTAGEHILNPDCSVRGVGAAELFYAKQIGYSLTPPALAFVIFGIWRLYSAASGISWRERATAKTHTPKDKMVVTLCVLLYFFWPTSLKQTFRLFSCRTIGTAEDGQDLLYLMADFEESCFVGRHLSFALAVGVTQILLYAIGLPLIVYVFLWRHRGELDKPVVKFRYGLFFAGFRQERYYWECVVALRKESTVVLAIFGSQMGVAMLAHVALLVFMVQILVQLMGDPYGRGHGRLQVLDVGAICLCWGTMWSGFFFYTPRPPDQKAALVFLTMTVVLVNTIYMMILLYSMCSEACKEHEDHSIVQVFQKRTSDFRDLTRKRLARMVMQEAGKNDIDTIHVSNPGMDHFAEVEMMGRGSNSTERKRVASVGATAKDRSWINRGKSKKRTRPERLPGGEVVPSAVQAERRKRLHSLHTRRASREESEMVAGFAVHFNPLMKPDNGDAKVEDAGTTKGSAGDDGWEDGGIEIHYDDDGSAYSFNLATGETAWLDSESD